MATSSGFGYAVEIRGNVLAVGAPFDNDIGINAGAVYIFELQDGEHWIETQKITSALADEQDNFGISVAIEDNYMVVGAHNDEIDKFMQGSVYVYRNAYGGWYYNRKLYASDATAYDNFGRCIDVGNQHIIVGATGKDDNGSNSGATYIYEIGSWAEYKLPVSNSDVNHRFGTSVAISGDNAFVGSRGLNSEDIGGIVYKYQFNGTNWIEESVIESPNSNLSEQFGATIDIDGGILLIGAPHSPNVWNYVGTTYVYGLDDGFNVHYDQQISASDYYYQDNFSGAIGVSGSKVIIGSANDDDRGSNSGSAYIYDVCERIELDIFPDTDVCRNTLVQMDVPQNANWLDKYGNSLATNTDEFEFVAVRDSQIVIEYYRPLLNCTAIDTISFTVIDPIISTNEYETKITACDAAASDYFGHSTDVYEEWAVVGATRDDFYGNDSGSAHVYKLGVNGWELSQKLIPSIGEATDYFGRTVAIYDNTILVSATRNSLIGYQTGAVFVFEFNGEYWEETQVLAPSDLIANEHFGIALDLNGNNLVVGAYDDDNGNASGSVRVYEKVSGTWQLSTKIISSDGSSGDRFGSSVAISEDGIIVVGAGYDDDTAGNSGSAYIYNKSGSDWNEQKIVAFDANYNDYFGYDVAIDSNIVIVGAYYDTDTYSRQGSVYFFTEVGGVWQEDGKIYAPNPNSNDNFGISVDIDYEYIIVGASESDSLFSNAGITYIYGMDDSNWQHINTIVASDGDYGDKFGYSVGISDYRAIVSSIHNDAVDTNSGAAYIYDLCEFDNNLCPYMQFDLKVWLEGAYNANTGEMTTTLNTGRGLLPGKTPVSPLAIPTPPGQPYNLPPWNFDGSEGSNFTNESYSADVVDWVLISLRSDVDKASEVLQFAALLFSDGTIEPVQRYSLSMLQDDEYYIVVEHRNHMGVMSPMPVSMEGNMICYDFTLQDSYRDATSVGQKELPSGEWVMLSGDFEQASDVNSYDITGNDKTEWTNDNGVFDGYVPADANLDGDVNGADKAFWEVNNGVSSRVPK